METDMVVDTSLATDCEHGIDVIGDIGMEMDICSREGGTQTVRDARHLTDPSAAYVLLKRVWLAEADVDTHIESNFIAELASLADGG
jgi:hypothetical protein